MTVPRDAANPDSDPIVEEVRRARRDYAARFNNDLAAMVADLQRRTDEARRAGREVVTRPPRQTQGHPTKRAG
ncbi:MAG: hypothetical protein WD042_17710 [Phycisphaeraceae bacterium]